MKMQREHYDVLKQAMMPFVSLAKENRNDLLKNNPSYANGTKDINKRVRWDLLWYVKRMGLIPEHFLFDTINAYLNDDHIDSALKKIAKELNF